MKIVKIILKALLLCGALVGIVMGFLVMVPTTTRETVYTNFSVNWDDDYDTYEFWDESEDKLIGRYRYSQGETITRFESNQKTFYEQSRIYIDRELIIEKHYNIYGYKLQEEFTLFVIVEQLE